MRSAFGVESPFHGERFEQGRLADAVFADEEGAAGMELETFPESGEGGNRIGILVPLGGGLGQGEGRSQEIGHER